MAGNVASHASGKRLYALMDDTLLAQSVEVNVEVQVGVKVCVKGSIKVKVKVYVEVKVSIKVAVKYQVSRSTLLLSFTAAGANMLNATLMR